MLIIMTIPCYKGGKLIITAACYKGDTSIITSLIIMKIKFVCFQKYEIGASCVKSYARSRARSEARSCAR